MCGTLFKLENKISILFVVNQKYIRTLKEKPFVFSDIQSSFMAKAIRWPTNLKTMSTWIIRWSNKPTAPRLSTFQDNSHPTSNVHRRKSRYYPLLLFGITIWTNELVPNTSENTKIRSLLSHCPRIFLGSSKGVMDIKHFTSIKWNLIKLHHFW